MQIIMPNCPAASCRQRNFANSLTRGTGDDGEDSSGWRDVTADVLHKERIKVRELERIRSLLYSDMVRKDNEPSFMMH